MVWRGRIEVVSWVSSASSSQEYCAHIGTSYFLLGAWLVVKMLSTWVFFFRKEMKWPSPLPCKTDVVLPPPQTIKSPKGGMLKLSLTSHTEAFQQHSWEAHAFQNGYESCIWRRLGWVWDPSHEPFPTCLRLQTLSFSPFPHWPITLLWPDANSCPFDSVVLITGIGWWVESTEGHYWTSPTSSVVSSSLQPHGL